MMEYKSNLLRIFQKIQWWLNSLDPRFHVYFLAIHVETKKAEAVCTPSPLNNEFKMITNYIVVFHGRDVACYVSL